MRRKILLILTVLSLLSIFVSGHVIFSIEKGSRDLEKVMGLHQVANLRKEMMDQIKLVQRDLSLKETRHARNFSTMVAHVSYMSDTVESCFGCHHSQEVLARLSHLRGNVENYKQALSRVYTVRADAPRLNMEEDNAFLTGEELVNEVEDILAFTNRNLQARTHRVFQKINRSKNVLFIFTIFVPFVVIGTGAWFYFSFKKPISSLLDATSRLKAGQLDVQVGELKDEFGEVARSFNDMTRSLKEVMQTMVRAEEMVLMGEMASRLAHEIKNPITGIKLAAEVIRDEAGLQGEFKDLCFKTIEQIKNIEGLMKGLLNFAKPPIPQLQPENLNRIIETAFSTVDILVKKRSDHGGAGGAITLHMELDENLPELMTDAGQVQQILLNLMLNAVDAMPRGGTLTVRSGRAPQGDFVQVDVVDSGTGIDPALGEKIFHPFFSTKIKGTGLGLATVRKLVDANKGQISFTSEPGKGTAFTVRLPILPPAKGVEA